MKKHLETPIYKVDCFILLRALQVSVHGQLACCFLGLWLGLTSSKEHVSQNGTHSMLTGKERERYDGTWTAISSTRNTVVSEHALKFP